MSKPTIIRCALSILMVAYLAVALVYAYRQESEVPYKSLGIHIHDAMESGFVTSDDINQELGDLKSYIATLPPDSVSIRDIESQILALDYIEDANCMVLNNHTVHIDVHPLVPVARVFDTATGKSYYLNRQGKRMSANPRYRIDVPVVVGDFTWKANELDLIPILDYLSLHPETSHLVSAIKVSKKGDIYLVPTIRGHIISFGDNANIENKFARLRAFYKKVLPVKGWEYYDTISVKWQGQIVANRRHAALPVFNVPEEDEPEVDDLETMSVGQI